MLVGITRQATPMSRTNLNDGNEPHRLYEGGCTNPQID